MTRNHVIGDGFGTVEENDADEVQAAPESEAAHTESYSVIVAKKRVDEVRVEQINWSSIPDIEDCFPSALMHHIKKLDATLQADIDTIALAHLPVLCVLGGGATIYDTPTASTGTPLIIYVGVFFKSGGGKTSTIKGIEEHWLTWLDKHYSELQEQGEQLEEEIKLKLKMMGKSKEEQAIAQDLTNQLREIKTQPDVVLDGATAEGLEETYLAGSIPLVVQDNFGKILRSAEKNEHYANLLRVLDNIFDSGRFSQKRTRSGGRAKQIQARGLGGYFASTIGDGNLKPKDIRDNIENGFFNKMLITIQDKLEKDLPLNTSLPMSEAIEIEEFAKKFRDFGTSRDFVLSAGALDLYREFHSEIGAEYKRRYNNEEDLAGMIIRQLKLSKRVACLYEISSKCETAVPITFIGEEPERETISVESMGLAINLLQYLRAVHIPKIMQYANSKDGKLSATDKVHNAIRRLNKDGIPADIRTISQGSRVYQKDGLLTFLEDLRKRGAILYDEKSDVYISNT